MQNLNVLIIGGGPAGMSCALWLKNYGMNPIIVEKNDSLGGLQARSQASNTWLLGWQSVLGKDVAVACSKHIAYERIQTMLNSRVTGITQLSESEWRVALTRDDGEKSAPKIITIVARAIVIATGTDFVSEKWIECVSGADKCKDSIHIGPSSYMNPNTWFGERPVIVGGGDNALECAYVLSRRGSSPIVLMRSKHFRADQESRAKLEADIKAGLVTLHTETEITHVSTNGDKRLEIRTNKNEVLLSDSILLMLGYEASSSQIAECFTADRPAMDKNNYFIVDGNCETNIPSVYAIGDVANPLHPCTSTAMAMGTMAARSINNRRVR